MKTERKALYRGEETEVEVVEGALLGEKISAGGMLLEPYEAVIDNDGGEVFSGIPEYHPDRKWMSIEDEEIDGDQPKIPAEAVEEYVRKRPSKK